MCICSGVIDSTRMINACKESPSVSEITQIMNTVPFGRLELQKEHPECLEVVERQQLEVVHRSVEDSQDIQMAAECTHIQGSVGHTQCCMVAVGEVAELHDRWHLDTHIPKEGRVVVQTAASRYDTVVGFAYVAVAQELALKR
jgi:hypothetical protein